MAYRSNIMKELYVRILNDDVPGFAAQLAYFFLLSLFPLLIFLMTLLPYLQVTQEQVLSFFRDFAPEDSMRLIETNLFIILNEQNGKLLSFGIIATLWSASNGINAIIKAFNRAYHVTENRSFFIARGVAILLTLAMIIVFIVALLLPVFGKEIGTFLFAKFGLSRQFLAIWQMFRWLFSSLILFIVFLALYYMAPNKKLTCKSAFPGAIFSTIGWIVTSLAFSYYVGNFGNYSATYGSIGGIIVLMIWFYLSGMIIIIGGEINAMVTKRKGEPC